MELLPAHLIKLPALYENLQLTTIFQSLTTDLNIKMRIKRWVDNQHLAMWRHPSSTQTQARKLISGPSPTKRTRLLSFSRTKSRVVIGLLTRHNTLRKHLHLMGLNSSLLCRRCGTENETSVHILCHCEALASLRHACLGSLFWTQRILSLSMGAIWNFSKSTGLPWPSIRLWGTLFEGLGASGPQGPEPNY
jgi:hypothetical protein